MALLRTIALTLVQRLIRLQFPEVKPISTCELVNWLNQQEPEKPLLLDVRKPEEYEVSHLSKARLASSQIQALRDRKDSNSVPIVVYCSVGYRSAKLAQQLQASGYQSVFNLEGSIFQWANEGRPVYREGKVVRQVHPFDRRWGLLLDPDLHAYERSETRTH